MAAKYSRWNPGPMHYEIVPDAWGGYLLKAMRYQGGLRRDLIYTRQISAHHIVWC